MNKKYMDFVPKSAVKKVERQPSRVTSKPEAKPVVESKAKVVVPSRASRSSVDKKLVEPIARPAFVNTEKVRKRPLSKNVYSKKTVAPKEEKLSAPVTIIDKPEKDSKVGLIVTIIITIILGAAAGTVAFLLLPR